MNNIIVFGVIGIWAVSLQYSGDSDGTYTTRNEGCFSYTFSTIEDLRSQLKNDTELRKYLVRKMMKDGESGEQPYIENSGMTSAFSGTDEFSATQPHETTTHEVSEAITGHPTTAPHSINVSHETSFLNTTSATVKPDSIANDKPLCLSIGSNMTNWRGANGSCYYFLKEWANKATYEEAKANCSEMGGRLAAQGIRDETILTFLSSNSSHFSDCKCNRFWIGLEYLKNEWQWSDNVTHDKIERDMTPNQPNSNNHCARIKRTNSSSSWNLRSSICNDKRRYICEK